MIEVELFDGTVLEFPEGTSQDVIDRVARQETMTRRGQKPGETEAPQNRGILQTIGDNVIGFDDGVNSPGERLGEMIRGGGAAVARGIADVPAIPANLAQIGAMGYEKLTGMDEPSAVSRGLNALPDTRDMLASVPIIGPESQYIAPGKAGEYISTAGEFAGGAGAMAGPGAMMRYGLLPGTASEGAGQATEGTAVEPYARAGAALLTPALTARTARTAQIPGRNPSRVAAANRLEDAGINPTAGQVTGSDVLRRVEGTTEASNKQLNRFTKAAMRKIGSSADDARPENLKAAQSAIVKRMDDAISGVNVYVPPQITSQIDDVMASFNRHIEAGRRSNVFDEISSEIRNFAQKPDQPVPLSTLNTWRSDLGRLTTSSDDAVRDAAHGFRKVIEDLTDDALRQSGRAKDILKLRDARNDYRNYLAVEDVATRKGAAGGDISPSQLNQAVIRTQGRKNYATGRGTEMMPFARSGEEFLASMPTVSPGGERLLQGTASGAGALAGYQLGGFTGAAAGAFAPYAAQGISRLPAIQNAIKNPASAAQPIPAMTPGLLSVFEN